MVIDKATAETKRAQAKANMARQMQHSSSSSSSADWSLSGLMHSYFSTVWEYFFDSRKVDSYDIYSIAKTGDIFLERVVESGFSSSLKTGLQASQEGNFSRKVGYLSPWNGCSIVVELGGEKYLLKATSSGVKAFSLARQLEFNKMHYQKCAIRPLHRQFSGIRHQDKEFDDVDRKLQDLCRSALSLELSWTGDSVQVNDDFFQLKTLLIDRLRKFTTQHTGEDVADALKVFYMLDSRQTGNLPVSYVKKAFMSLLDKREDAHEEDRTRIMQLINEIDVDGDDNVSIYEFVACYLKLPTDKLTNEIDLVQLTMAEFVACVFFLCGISSDLCADTYFMPTSFSSLASHQQNECDGATLSQQSKSKQGNSKFRAVKVSCFGTTTLADCLSLKSVFSFGTEIY